MRKIIKIFIASSIVEFANERMAIENFIRNISDKFEESYDVKIQPLLCENFDDAYSKKRKQEEYNEKIRDSELCFFIFFTRAGEYTREEFEVARKKFEETGKPKIYTYFKIVKDEKVEQSLHDFMEELDKVFGHYYGTFEHVDTVKLRILLSLKLQEMDFVEIKAENGTCVVDGKSVMPLNNVSEFVNNKNLESMQAELQRLEEEYYQLKPIYAKGDCDSSFYKHYSNVASKRQNLIDEIDELQRLIFNVSLRMSYDDVHGEITRKQKEAYRLFELGDYEGCMAVLNSKDIDDDFLRTRKKIKEQDIAVCRKYIKEHKTAIDILKTMRNYKDRFAEIDSRYEKIIPIIFEEEIELDTAGDYAFYLAEQNREIQAIKIVERLIEVKTRNAEKIDADWGWLYDFLGSRYSHQNQPQKAETFFLKALEIYEPLARENPERFAPDLAVCYNNAAIFYHDQGQLQEAEKYDLKVIEILEPLARKNSERFPELATCYNNAAAHFCRKEPQKAEGYYLKAIEIFETLARGDSERFAPDLAACYNNAAVHFCGKQPQKAKEFYFKAIEIYEVLARENSERFVPDLANSYNNVAGFYQDQGQSQKADEYYFKAIEIYEALVRERFERFAPNLANSYYNAGCFCQKESQKEKEYCLKAIEIYETLARKNPEKFSSDFAVCYNNAANSHLYQKQLRKAEEYYLKAIEIYEALAGENPEKIDPHLALCYSKYGVLCKNNWYLEKALQIAKERQDHPLCRQIIADLK